MSSQTQSEKRQFKPFHYVIQIDVAPYGSEISDLAYHFCRTLLEAGEHLDLVFFYSDGVYHALKGEPPQGEENKTERWRVLASQFGFPMAICSSSAQRRGVKLSAADQNAFQITGLARLVEAILQADRYLRFG